MTKPEFEQLLQRYLLGEVTEDEKASIRAWFDKINTEPEPPLNEAEKCRIEERLFSDIENKINTDRQKKVLNGWLRAVLKYGSAAAALVLAVFLSKDARMYTNALTATEKSHAKPITAWQVTKINNGRTCERIVLEDSTQVHLTQGSRITYRHPFERNKRVVFLTGAGSFHVSKNPHRPFYVHCGKTVTKVIGTSFWVHANKRSESVEIGVKTGKVSVMINPASKTERLHGKTNSEILLTPNQRAVFFEREKKIEKSLVTVPEVLKTPEIASLNYIYEDTPLVKIMQELSRSYNVQIVMLDEKLKKCTFTGDLTALTFLEKFELICHSVGSRFYIQGTSIILTGSNCTNTP